MSQASCKTSMYEEVKTGLISSAAVAIAAGIRGQMELGTAMRPLNGISHILWGPQAGKSNTISAKYTLTGLALNTVACGFWAWLYQRSSRSVSFGSGGRCSRRRRACLCYRLLLHPASVHSGV